MVDNIKGYKYIMYPRFIQMLIDDQVKDLPKDPADELDLHHMKSETFSRLNQYKGLKKDEPEPRVKRMICKIENPNYVAPENDVWRHNNSNSEDETDSLSGMHEKKLRCWFVKDGKRKRTPKASPTVTAPKLTTLKIVVKEPAKKKSTPTPVDEPVIDPTELMQQGVELMKETLDNFIKRNEEAKAAAQVESVEKAAESSAKHVEAVRLKEKDVEGVAHSDSSDADDESSDTESEIDKSKIGVGKITLKKKPLKKKKGSDEEDETYIPTPQAEKNKDVLKRKANPQGVIHRRVRARKGSASVTEIQSVDKDQNVEAPKAKVQQVQSVPEVEVETVDKPEVEKKCDDDDDDDDEVVFTCERISTPPPPENPTIHILDDPKTSKPKKHTFPGLFEGFPNVQGEFTDDILPDEDYDMFHDGTIKELTKKVRILEKEKAKVEAKRDELKKTLEKTMEVNEEMKSDVNDHAERIDALTENLADNAKLIDQLTNELAEVNARYENMNETNQTLHQMLDDLHEASSNENKVLKLEIEALRADKAVKDEQLNMLYIVVEHKLGINVQAIYNDLEIQRVEERRAQREKELAEAATQKNKELVVESQEAGSSSSQPEGDVQIVDAEEEHMEVDPEQSFALVSEALSRPYNLNDIIRMVKVEQRKGKVRAADVKLLCYKEDKEVNEEEEEVDDEELKDILDAVDNYDPSWDDYDDDEDQGATGLLIVKAEMLEELGLDDGNLKFDIEDEIPSSSEKDYELKLANEADNFNHVEIEEGSDTSEEDTPYHYSGVDDTFPTFAEMFKSQNEDELRRKVIKKITTEGIPETVPQETLLEGRKNWFKVMPKERKFKRHLQYFTDHPYKSLGDILSWGYLEDLQAYAIGREQGVQYLEFLSDIKTLPWWDVEKLV
ncbi:hypothetical protein Hanom_Chr04g00338111 [Helianthus anomalus]